MLLPITCFLLVLFVRAAHAHTCVCVATEGGGSLNIRSCGSSSCGVVGVEQPGQCFAYITQSGGWFNFNYGSSTAWASGSYMSGPQECADGTADCFHQLCEGNVGNVARGHDAYGDGNYLASRSPGLHYGVDVECTAGSNIYAPISGRIRQARPYGNGQCCDDGFAITGSGLWDGHVVKVFYNTPMSCLFGTDVVKGQLVGHHIGLHCSGCYPTSMTDHSHIQDTYSGSKIDPSGWLYC